MASSKRPAASKTASSKPAPSKPASSASAGAAGKTAQKQRALQREIDAGEAHSKAKAKKSAPTQAGMRKQPEKMPRQHLRKPGKEQDLALRPRFEAPDYVGSGKLRGMSAIVTGCAA